MNNVTDKKTELPDDLKYMFEALAEIKKQAPKKCDCGGFIKCPQCGKRLKWSMSGINGHVWGKCETENCLSWMM